MPASRAHRIAAVLLALFLIGVGLALIVYGARMRVSPLYARSGPQLFPWLIGGLTAAVGVAALVQALRDRLLPDDLPQLQLSAGLIMASGLLFQILTIKWLGWIPTATVVMVAGAQSFRREKLLLDIAIGLILAVVTYFFFSRLLGLRLPVGTLFAPLLG